MFVRGNMIFDAEVDELIEDLRYYIRANPEVRPTLLRLVFCQNGMHIFNRSVNTSAANTASLRYYPHSVSGLNNVIALLNEVCSIYPGVGAMDMWTLAACVALEEMGGPPVTKDWQFGRIDATQAAARNEIQLLPDPARHGEAGCLKNMIEFSRMGFTIQEFVCLMGAHTLGAMHKDVSGYTGSWTKDPNTFSNEYFKNLKEYKWRVLNKGTPHAQYAANGVTMLPADIALLQNDETYKYVKRYAESEEEFTEDFRKVWKRLTDLNMELRLQDPLSHRDYPSAILLTGYMVWWGLEWMAGYRTYKQENELMNQDTIDYIKKRLRELA
eukprot:TRINITY_DN19523_c0_g1_i2.p1 TRINITY_DN19523_c0_g1~~TRINITY_DN19523_c0_g1_i2.p1  ORF type:complete len:327 (+),score=33.76 TRINITY_DN19523_c0_g1_i2:194-1174(+)